MQHIIFKNPVHQDFFDKNGFVKIQLLNKREVEDLIQFHRDAKIPVGEGFSTNFSSSDSTLKKTINSKVVAVFEDIIKQHLNDYRAIFGTFLCKRNDTKIHMDLHQDWSFVDEEKGFVSLNIWCPLIETNEKNGMLYILPNSHTLKKIIRVSPTGHPVDKIILDGYAHLIQPIPTQLGEAILFNNALFHGSGPNTSGEDRLVVGLFTVPKNSECLLFYQTDNGIEKRLANTEFFIEKNPFIEKPTRLIELIDTPIASYSEEDFYKILGKPRKEKIFFSWIKNLFK